MFKNPGRKLMALAKVIFWIIVVCGILSAISAVLAVVFTMRYAPSYFPVLAVFGVLIWAGINVLVAWLASIRLYAVGQQIEDTAVIREKVDYLCQARPVPPAAPQARPVPPPAQRFPAPAANPNNIEQPR